MYQFLYLFAPGVLSWLVSMRGRQADGEQMEKEQYEALVRQLSHL